MRSTVITPRRAIHEAKRAAAVVRRIKQLWSQVTLSRAFWSITDPAEVEEEEENICLFYMTCREASPTTGVSLDSYGRT